jgi:hypothetical protein
MYSRRDVDTEHLTKSFQKGDLLKTWLESYRVARQAIAHTHVKYPRVEPLYYLEPSIVPASVFGTVPEGGLRMQRLKRFLPMFLNGSRYDTTADTGSLENALSAHEARRLALQITGRGRRFLMGNGSMTISLGTVRLQCTFALGESCASWQSFNVIDNLAVPVIMGKAFLDLTKTLTLHQYRLEAVWMSAKKAFRVMHLNRPRQLMRCSVNGKPVLANPDTGSEVDLMSPLYACQSALKIEALEEDEGWVQLADGRVARLLGKTHVDLDFYDGGDRWATGRKSHSRTFYLLDGLGTDVLLGEEVLYDMHVFTEHEDSFVDSGDCEASIEMNLITWFDKRNRQMSDALAVLSSPTLEQGKSPLLQRRDSPVRAATLNLKLYFFTNFFIAVTQSEAQGMLNKLHAHELHQRELATQKLAALSDIERPVQERLEQARRIAYDTVRDLLIQRRDAAADSSQQHATTGSPAQDPGPGTSSPSSRIQRLSLYHLSRRFRTLSSRN